MKSLSRRIANIENQLQSDIPLLFVFPHEKLTVHASTSDEEYYQTAAQSELGVPECNVCILPPDPSRCETGYALVEDVQTFLRNVAEHSSRIGVKSTANTVGSA